MTEQSETAPVPNVRQGAVSGLDHEPLEPREKREPSTLAGHPDYREQTDGDPEGAPAAADDGDPAGDGEEVLRGEALDQALEDRGLSKSGTADEKRARVAEYDEQQ